jgi:hypothetical protein
LQGGHDREPHARIPFEEHKRAFFHVHTNHRSPPGLPGPWRSRNGSESLRPLFQRGRSRFFLYVQQLHVVNLRLARRQRKGATPSTNQLLEP